MQAKNEIKTWDRLWSICSLLTKLIWSRWLDINLVLFLRFYGPRWSSVSKYFCRVIIWLQNITVVKIKVVIYMTGNCIQFVSRFLFRNSSFSVVYQKEIMRQFILPFYTERSQHRTKGGNVTQKIMNISNIHPTSDILCANYLWFSGGILLLNNADCLTYLFIKLVNEILDMTSYNRDKFILSVTIVSKGIMETSFYPHQKLLTDDEVLMAMLWSLTYERQTEK